MEGWFKIASVVVTATAAAVVAIAAFYETQRQENERRQIVHVLRGGNITRERINNAGFRVTNNQGQSSEDSTIERKREAEAKRKLAKLKEERRKQLEEEEKKRKEEENERKRKREEEEKERKRKREEEEKERKRKREEEEKEKKKNEKMKSMLDSFDDVFDDEMGVKTDRVHVDDNIDDWSRNTEKQKLKLEFRAKQMAQQHKSQDEKDQITSNNRTDDLKIEQQKSTIKKCLTNKTFKIQQFLLNAIVSVNIENKFTLALSLRSIKKNKKKKVIDLQELESAVLSLQEISQENESPKTSTLSKNARKKLAKNAKKKAEEITQAVEKKQEDKLETVESHENCRSTLVQKQLEDQKRKLELEKKKREERLVEWELMRQSRQNYQPAPTISTENHSNIDTLRKQLGNQNRKVNFEVNRREEAENMNFKPNSHDDEIVYEDNYYKSHYQLVDDMFQTKSNFAGYKKTKDKKEKINGSVEIEKLKVAKQKSTMFEPACSNKFQCPRFLLYAIINVNTTNNNTVAASLRGIEKNKKKKVIDLHELESAVCDLQEILQDDSIQDHALPENVTEKVKKPKTREQIAARKRRKQLRKQKGMVQ